MEKNIQNDLGTRLRKRRKELRLTLKEVAETTGLTASFLSQVEHNKANLSLNSLRDISDALAVPVAYLMAEDIDDDLRSLQTVKKEDHQPRPVVNPVVTKDRRSKLVLPGSGVELELLVPSFQRKMALFKGRLEPGKEQIASRLREPTEEVIYVLSGELLVELKTGEYLVHQDESIFFEGYDLICMKNVSDEETSYLSIITPPVF